MHARKFAGLLGLYICREDMYRWQKEGGCVLVICALLIALRTMNNVNKDVPNERIHGGKCT